MADLIPIRLINPLPAALQHYLVEVESVLAPATCTVVGWVSIEGAGWRRPFRAARHVLAALRVAPGFSLVCWPALGLLEPLVWLRHRHRVVVVVHDAAPLRRQVGFGRAAAFLGGLAVRAGVGVAVHSPAAATELAARGWPPPLVVPHPIAGGGAGAGVSGAVADRSGRDAVRVLGQFKPARSLQPLAQLAAEGPARREIVGRGWPSVAGWSVRDEFVPDADFDRLIAASTAIVIPYSLVFQSGVAVRALERGTPVVLLPAPGVALTWGADWPGFVHDGDWAGALRRVADVEPAELARRLQAAVTAGRAAWLGLAGSR